MGYEVFQGPTELIQYNPDKAYQGYTLFSPPRGRNTYLIDMHGEVVHLWPYPEESRKHGERAIEQHARLLEDGLLLRAAIIHRAEAGGIRGIIYQLVNWEGEVIWEHNEERPGYSPHHDFRMIWNPILQERTLLYIASRAMSHEEALALGIDPRGREDLASWPDGLVEIDMEGNVIWEWNISDHTVQDRRPDKANFGSVAENPGKLDVNWGKAGSGDWIHLNAFDYNETLDQLVISNSVYSEVQVIDHGATFVAGDPDRSIALAASEAGDFIYRWGNPCTFDAGECPSLFNDGSAWSTGHQQAFFIHDVQWIREKEVNQDVSELPGAGNMLIFDNGARRPGPTYSSVIEFKPYEGSMADGIYVDQMAAGHTETGNQGQSLEKISNQIVWRFSGILPNAFYSHNISGAQRLPNGNTLVNSGAHGHFFEVTREGEVAWEYVSPVGDRTLGAHGIYHTMADTDQTYSNFNAVFRISRYSPDYPGLAGKDLSPMGTITELMCVVETKPSRYLNTPSPPPPPPPRLTMGEFGNMPTEF